MPQNLQENIVFTRLPARRGGPFFRHSAKFYGWLKRSRLPILGIFCYK